jgi:L-lactate dehydrogenase complex protein LldF
VSVPVRFVDRADLALGTAPSKAVHNGARVFTSKRDVAVADYPALDEMRDRSRRIRMHTLAHLDTYLARFSDAAEANGVRVHFAADAGEAVAIVLAIAAEGDAHRSPARPARPRPGCRDCEWPRAG